MQLVDGRVHVIGTNVVEVGAAEHHNGPHQRDLHAKQGLDAEANTDAVSIPGQADHGAKHGPKRCVIRAVRLTGLEPHSLQTACNHKG